MNTRHRHASLGWVALGLAAASLSGCGISDVDLEGEIQEALALDFEVRTEGGFLSVTPLITNTGDRALTVIEPHHCDEDLLIHASADPASPVIWRQNPSSCTLEKNSDLPLAPGESAEGPSPGTFIPNLVSAGVPPGEHFLSFRWELTVRVDGRDLDIALEERVSVITVTP